MVLAGRCRDCDHRAAVTDRQYEKKSRESRDPRDGQDEQDREPVRKPDRRPGAVYQGTFEAVIALLIAVGIGHWLDGTFDTAPWLLLLGTAIGFASFTVRLIRLGRWMRDRDLEEARQADESER